MKPCFRSLLVFSLLCGLAAFTVRAADAPDPAAPAVRELRIDPGKTGIPLGSARLLVDPLVHTAGKDGLSAGYKVEVTPFTFKNEAGRFSVAISEADLRRLAGGETLHFTGQAVSQDGANTSEVQGRATPTGGTDGGDIRIQVEGKKGKLVFHTMYHLAR